MSKRILVIEGAAGPARRRWLAEHVTETPDGAARTFNVCCDFDAGGPWAGVGELFSALLPEIQAERPDLIDRHLLELMYILPELRRTLSVRNPCLTDLSEGPERTRNYPADRAYRNVHGLIDLLDSWKTTVGLESPWIVVCDFYDNAGAMGTLFFQQLMRRRGERLNFQLVLGVTPGQGEATRKSFDAGISVETTQIDLPAAALTQPDPAEAERLALELEEHIGSDSLEKKINLSKLIHLWSGARRPDKLLTYKCFGLETYNTAGLYADALRYGQGLFALVAEQSPVNLQLKWSVFVKLIMSHLGLNDVQSAFKLTEEEGLKIAEQCAEWQADLFYYMAMFYARFLKPRDLAKGEEYLDRGLEQVAIADLPEGQRHFNVVFNRNGLAMIRTFQGRLQDAIDLCRAGIATLDAYLGADEHRLHRSVLYYNTAQVYHAIGLDEEAVKYYSIAMEMDPNYSEYHNERANAYLTLERLEEAQTDYLKAIELSPPYFEVFTNLGQCYRRQGVMEKAIASYSRALDIEPSQMLALLGRAKCYEETAHFAEAIRDYTAAIGLDASQWEATASRGVLFYETGDLPASLADFDCAIKLKPEVADLYQNRATVLADLGRVSEAEGDLRQALSLNPSTEDVRAIQQKLDSLKEQYAELAR